MKGYSTPAAMGTPAGRCRRRRKAGSGAYCAPWRPIPAWPRRYRAGHLHQRQLSRAHGHIGACAHGNADVGPGQGGASLMPSPAIATRCPVPAVRPPARPCPLGRTSPNPSIPSFSRHRAGGGVPVPGGHHNTHAGGAQRQSLRRWTLYRIGYRQQAGELPIHRQVHDAGAPRPQGLRFGLPGRASPRLCSAINAVLPRATALPSTAPRTPIPEADSKPATFASGNVRRLARRVEPGQRVLRRPGPGWRQYAAPRPAYPPPQPPCRNAACPRSGFRSYRRSGIHLAQVFDGGGILNRMPWAAAFARCHHDRHRGCQAQRTGQAMINTATALIRPKAQLGSGPNRPQSKTSGRRQR